MTGKRTPRTPIDTNGLKQGQDQLHNLPSDQPIVRDEFFDEFEIVDTPMPKDTLAAHAFFEEMIEIEIQSTGTPGEEQVIPLSCNNVNQFIIRDTPTLIRRKYVEILARAKKENVTTPEYQDANGNRATSIKKTQGLRYPFRVIHDPNPEGLAWLRNVLQQAA